MRGRAKRDSEAAVRRGVEAELGRNDLKRDGGMERVKDREER